MAERNAVRHVYTIDPGAPFLKTLIPGILQRIDHRQEVLPDIRIFLPTRRACREFQTEFLRYFEGRPVLLPRLQPLGDIDPDDLTMQLSGYDPEMAKQELDIPPALPPLKRSLILARMIRKMPDYTRSTEQAVALAAELGRLIDRIHTEDLDMARLADLVPEDFSEHWQITLEFLNILSRSWPEILAEQGRIDAADRRNRLTRALAGWYKNTRPDDIVIAAGSSGSIPATAELLRAIAGLENGAVILPGLDRSLSEDGWAAIGPTHPQYMMKRLIDKWEIRRSDITLWSGKTEAEENDKEKQGPCPARQWLTSTFMAPAQILDQWAGINISPEYRRALRNSLEKVRYITAPTPESEARIIALAFREVLADPKQKKTAALVTPDRDLARRVSAALQRWGVEVDDSAGLPLSRTRAGSFLSLSARAYLDNLRPVALLAMLKHSLTNPLADPARFRHLVRVLDKHILRGPAPKDLGAQGLLSHMEGLVTRRQEQNRPTGLTGNEKNEIEELIRHIGEAGENFTSLLDGEPHRFEDFLNAHIDLCESLAGGAEHLWVHEDGEAAALLLAELNDSRMLVDPVPARDYLAVLIRLMEQKAVRPLYGTHPRLRILGQLESRLIDADLVILAGLNEGSWPPEADKDPWMSRPMRKEFKMSSPDESIGKAAHDFSQLFNHGEIMLTRSLRSEGTPSVPSRWLQRLKTVLKALNAAPGNEKSGEAEFSLSDAGYPELAELLDTPTSSFSPPSRPKPNPPVSARPRQLSVTAIENWIRDPYHIYASKILGLKKLDPPEKDAEASERGEWIHDVMKEFIRAWPCQLPKDPEARLRALGWELLGPRRQEPAVMGFWWPRFENIIAWVVDYERKWRRRAKPCATEVKGALTWSFPAGKFTLTARADRIDSLPGGKAAIIDYKTGSAPAKKEILNSLSPQMPLEALIVNDNGFEGVRNLETEYLAYWQISGSWSGNSGSKGGKVIEVTSKEGGKNPLDMQVFLEECREGLSNLITAFDAKDENGEPLTPYYSLPRPQYGRREEFQDFAHLARVKEWRVLSDDSSGGDE